MDLSLYGFDGLTKTYNIHPAFVHFPIALLPVTLLFYALGFVWRKQGFLTAGRGCLYLSTVSVITSVITGLIAQNTVPHNDRIHHMMDTHRITGLIILGLTVVLNVWSFVQSEQRPKAPWAFLLGTAVACYFALQNGDLGSRMVYLEGAGVKPAVSVIGAEGHEHGHSSDEHHEQGEHGKNSEDHTH